MPNQYTMIIIQGVDPKQLAEVFRAVGISCVVVQDVRPQRLSHLTTARERGGSRKPSKHPFGLTPRELEVIQLVKQGMSNREIGESLVITPGTVKTHLMHIFEKTGCESRWALAVKSIEEQTAA